MLTYDYSELAEAADALATALDKYEDLRCSVIEKLQGQERDQPPYLYGVLFREAEAIANARDAANKVKQLQSTDEASGDTRITLLDRCGAAVAEVGHLVRRKENHRTEHEAAIAEAKDTKVIGAKIARDLAARADALADGCAAFEKARSKAIAELRVQADLKTPNRKDADVADQTKVIPIETSQFERLIDAVSAMGGTSTPTQSGNSYANFGLAVDQRLNLSIGMPNLGSEGAIAMSRTDLLSKLKDGLARAVTTDVVGGVKTFSFNPLQARGASVDGTQAALGGQAVLNDTVRALRGPMIDAVYRMKRETLIDDHGEGDDLRFAIERGIDDLIVETASATGYFKARIESLFTQIALDVVSLAGLIGVMQRCEAKTFVPEWLTIDAVTKKRSVPTLSPNFKAAIGVDPDVGVLTAEANDQALSVIFEHLTTIKNLMGRSQGGATLGRIRAINEALPQTVASVRSGLSAAGLSTAELGIFANHDATDTIDLNRLLSWIESESLHTRATLLRDDLNLRDLDRLITTRATQSEALKSLYNMEFQTTPNNRYAVGRRHMAELSTQIAELTSLLSSLLEQNLTTTR